MLRQVTWAAVAAAVVSGCGGFAADPAGGSSGPGEALAVELGGGRTEFVELTGDRPELEVVSGPQGGWHFELTLRLTNYDGGDLVLDYRARDEAGADLGFSAQYAVDAERLLELDDGRHVRVGDRVVLDVTGPEVVADTNVVVECRALRGTEELASDTRTVRAVDRVDELL